MKTPITDCFALSTNLLKKDLKKARQNEPVENEFLNFRLNGRPAALDYSVEYDFSENAYLVIKFGPEPQKILLSTRELTFGIRSYLNCGCGSKVNALYLKNTFFACRNCHHLSYPSTKLNNRSDHGRFFYQQNKRLELLDMRESISRVFYKSQYTKKFLRWLKLCNQAGLFRETVAAKKTIDAINEYKKNKKDN